MQIPTTQIFLDNQTKILYTKNKRTVMTPLEPRQVAINMVKKYIHARDIAISYRYVYDGGTKGYIYWSAVIEEIELIQKKIRNPE